ncbi:MAG: hypothetical protein ABMB14_16600 [Myxococcota bacterium]
MSGTYEPPADPEERLIEIALDPWTNRARTVLWLCGMVDLLLGVALGPVIAMPLFSDGTTSQAMAIGALVGVTLVSLVLGGGFGLVQLVTAGGLGRGSRWAWYVTLVLGAVYIPGACCLLGAVLLAAMLNEKTRRLFLG